MRRTLRRNDRGSFSLELALLVPALLALIGLLIAVYLVGRAAGLTDSAARAAAREATLVADPAEAQKRAEQAARASLEAADIDCTDLTVTVDVSGLSAPLGETSTVEARVVCTVPLVGLTPGLAVERESTFVSVVDRFRERS